MMGMLSVVGISSALVACIFLFASTNANGNTVRNETSNDQWYDPELENTGRSYATQFQNKTIRHAIEYVRKTKPGANAVLVPPGYDRKAFWNANKGKGHAVAFQGRSVAQDVALFDVGNDVVWVPAKA